MKPQRNSPCPCGSGKKYKKCCLSKEPTWQEPEPPDPFVGGFGEPLFDGVLPSPDELMSPEYWDNLMRRLPPEHRQELAPIIAQGKRLAEYEARGAQIEEAAEALEPYRGEFEKLLRRPGKFFEQARQLFDEEIFASMRFHAGDVQRAFDAVGVPVSTRDDETAEKLHEAIRFLVDGEGRDDFSRQLLSMLPSLVKAERFIDAWIVHHSALVLAEAPDGPVGPFLLSMFAHGVAEWEEERDKEQQAMLDAVGLTAQKVKNAGLAGAEALLLELAQDPEKSSLLEKFVDDHPELRAFAEAQARNSEEAALDLLEREDARCALLLTPDEVAPWLPVIEQRVVDSGLKVTRSKPNKATVQKFSEIVYEASAEMAGEFWTRSRLEMLRARILEYRRTLKPKDREGVASVTGVLMAAGSPTPPQENHFLTLLCWESVRAAVESQTSAAFGRPASTATSQPRPYCAP